jgi:hypothetical protein
MAPWSFYHVLSTGKIKKDDGIKRGKKDRAERRNSKKSAREIELKMERVKVQCKCIGFPFSREFTWIKPSHVVMQI